MDVAADWVFKAVVVAFAAGGAWVAVKSSVKIIEVKLTALEAKFDAAVESIHKRIDDVKQAALGK